MNFQAVEQANGNNVNIWATMTEYLGITEKDGKLKLKCKLKDDSGVTHNVHIHKGTGELPGAERLNQRMEFSLSTFDGNYQGKSYLGYSGFWIHGNTSQNTAKTPQNASQSTNATPRVSGTTDVRNCVVCSYIQSGNEPIIQRVEYWVKYIIEGREPEVTGPREMSEEEWEDRSDIPEF